jgi:TatD DNase family protein
LAPIASWVDEERPTAIGEVGLDGYEEDGIPPLESQVRAFEVQLDWASRLRLPVTVHSRRAVARVIDLLAAFPSVRGVLHAYTGSLEQVEPLLARGWMIGVGGSATRPSAHKIRRMVARLPVEAMLLETDAPAIGLEGVRPPFVRPVHLVSIARLVAEVKGLDWGLLVAQTDDNASRLFGLPVSAWAGECGPVSAGR